MEDEKAMSKALAARKRFVDSVHRITQEGSWKSLATVRREVALQEATYKGALTRIAAKNAAAKSAGGGFFAGGKGVGAAFQVQQMIEDYSYAGFRGLSNNLAFLGASLGGKAGLAVIAGVAAKGLYDLTAATMGWGKAAEEAAERGKRAADVMAQVDEIRRQNADLKTGFRAPDDMVEFRRREEQLRRDERRLSLREPAQASESDLRIMRRMLEIRQELKDAEETESRTRGFGFVGGVAGERAAALRETMGLLQSKLTVPVDIDNLETIIKKRQEAHDAALKDDGLLKNRIDTERKLLAEAAQLVPIKERVADLEDEIADKLREQQRAQERLVETARDRAKSVRDSILSASDSFEAKMLDTRSADLEQRFKQRIDRMVEIDARQHRAAFGRMNPMAGDAMKGRFEAWLGRRGDMIRQRGEGELFNQQFRLAQQRAHALKARAEQEAAAARTAGRRGDLDGMNDGYAKTLNSLEQIQELNWKMQSRGDNFGRSQQWLKVVQDFQKQIVSIQNEQAQANEQLADSHQTVTQELEQTEARLKEITKQIKTMNATDDRSADSWKKLNAELDGTLKRLQQLQSLKDGKGKAPAPQGADGPPGAGVGQATVTNRRKKDEPKERRKEQRWTSPDRWGADGNFVGKPKADTYAAMVKKALRTKEDELLQNGANAGTRQRVLGSLWRMSGPIFQELEGGADVSARRAEQLAEELKQILGAINAIEAVGPVKVHVDIIERHHSIRQKDGTYKQLPQELMGMPRNYRGVRGYRARGGPVSANAPYVVGENGRELFIPHTGGHVVNATDTRRMLSGGQRSSSDIATTTMNTFNSNFGGITVNTANVDLQDIQRQADWRQKAKKARMGHN